MSRPIIVVYTAIFGGYDGLLPQPNLKGVDYVCFTDSPLKKKPWKVFQVKPISEDPARSSKIYKINPHKFLNGYQRSIWIDGNFIVRGEPVSVVHEWLDQRPMWVFDHNQTASDPRNCIYQEYEALVRNFKISGKLKDKMEVMTEQIARYRAAGYPENNGLLSGGVLIREHHHPEVVKTMELWWKEIQGGSRRDQLSFNFAAWCNKFDFGVIDGDIRRNKYFFHMGKHRSSYMSKYFRYRLKRVIGLV